jgi:hypothetical protein
LNLIRRFRNVLDACGSESTGLFTNSNVAKTAYAIGNPVMLDPIDNTLTCERGESRRHILRRSAFLLATTLVTLGLPALSRAQEAKTPKNQAGYKDEPNGKARCDSCAQFLPPGSCKLVQGSVSPSGWCNFFTPRPH